MRRTPDEIDRAVTQRRIGLVDRENQFERDIESLGFEKSQLDRRFGWEIRVGNHIRDGKFHRINFFFGVKMQYMVRSGADNVLPASAPPCATSTRGRTFRPMIAAASLTTRHGPRR